MELISTTEFARRIGVSRTTVIRAVDKRRITLIPDPTGDMKIPWPDAQKEWAERGDPARIEASLRARGKLKTETVVSSSSSSMTWADAKARKDAAAALIAELDLAERKGDLVPKELVERQAFAAGRRVRDAILNVPNRIADQLAAEPDRHKCHTLLTAELITALEELAATDWNEVPDERDEGTEDEQRE